MTEKRAKRQRVATGIYKDKYGYSIVIQVNGKPDERRHDLTCDVEDLVVERNNWIKKVAAKAVRDNPTSDNFRNDVTRYMNTIPADVKTGVKRRRTHSDIGNSMSKWLDALGGDQQRDTITAMEIQTIISGWLNEPLSEATCDKRRGALASFYNTMNGKTGYNPTRAVKPFAPDYDDPRGFDVKVILVIIDGMPDIGKPKKGETRGALNESKIRMRVMATTGIPPQTLKEVEEDDINLKAKTLKTKKRTKGKGAAARLLPLSDEAVIAFRAFIKAKLYGWFDQSAVNRCFKRAVKSAREAWEGDEPFPLPANAHCYDVRHSHLSQLFRVCGDAQTVGFLGIHSVKSNGRMTARYTQAAVNEVARAAVDGLNHGQ